jgi:hypothetical protein
MQLARPAFALDPKQFGKSHMLQPPHAETARPILSSDFKHFATTFLAGFVFVWILIG